MPCAAFSEAAPHADNKNTVHIIKLKKMVIFLIVNTSANYYGQISGNEHGEKLHFNFYFDNFSQNENFCCSFVDNS